MADAEAPACSDTVDKVLLNTLASLPEKPQRITNVEAPAIEISRVSGTCFNVQVVYRFQAHYSDAVQLPVTLGNFQPASVPQTNAWLPKAHKELRSGGTLSSGSSEGQVQLSSVPLNSAAADQADAARSHQDALNATASGSSGSLKPQLSKAPSLDWKGMAPMGVDSWLCDPGQVVLGKRLAVGGFAEVFIGKYEGTVVAVKVLLDEDERTLDQMRREVMVLCTLRHPNLILFMGFCVQPRLAILSEYMHRGSLYKVLRDNHDRPLDPRLQRSFALSVARGMAYLHTRQPPILHLDLKSPNILVDDKWRFKVTDFGLARLRHSTQLTKEDWGGTPEWAAPELLRCEVFDETADVYSFGILLWEVMTGQAPWAELMPIQVIAMVGFQHQKLPLPEGCLPELAELYHACVQADPQLRPTFPDIVAKFEQQQQQATTGQRWSDMCSVFQEGTEGPRGQGRRISRAGDRGMQSNCLSEGASRRLSHEAGTGAKTAPPPEGPRSLPSLIPYRGDLPNKQDTASGHADMTQGYEEGTAPRETAGEGADQGQSSPRGQDVSMEPADGPRGRQKKREAEPNNLTQGRRPDGPATDLADLTEKDGGAHSGRQAMQPMEVSPGGPGGQAGNPASRQASMHPRPPAGLQTARPTIDPTQHDPISHLSMSRSQSVRWGAAVVDMPGKQSSHVAIPGYMSPFEAASGLQDNAAQEGAAEQRARPHVKLASPRGSTRGVQGFASPVDQA